MPEKQTISPAPLLFRIEVPESRRKTFWNRPNAKLEFWAFTVRPRAFRNEKIVFTFDKKPVAEAVIVKIEDPGQSSCSATKKYKDHYKVFWSPKQFIKYETSKVAAKWIGPVYHGTTKAGFKKLKGDVESAGMIYFTDDTSYADYFTTRGGEYRSGSGVYPAYIRFNKPFDARRFEDPMTFEEFAEAIGTTEEEIEPQGQDYVKRTHPNPFWRWVRTFPDETRKALESKGYDGIVQLESISVEEFPSTAAYIVFNESQVRSMTGDKRPSSKNLLDLSGKTVTADRVMEGEEGEEFWAGEGNAASGVLPVCPTTGNVCLAWRSADVMQGNCWGTIGGAVQKGMQPQQSAKVEMAEETGYHGNITLIPAYVFSSGKFKYHNFVGVVPNEFGFNPGEGHGWETDHIAWMPYAEVLKDMQENPGDYHPGMHKLFDASRRQIERALNIKRKQGAAPYTMEAHRSGDVIWVDWFEVKDKGKGLGRKYYMEWESKLPKDIKLVRLFAADAAGDFWDKMGFSYVYDTEQGDESDQYMWKGVNGNPTPQPVENDYESDGGYDIEDEPEKRKKGAEQKEMFPNSQDAKFRQWFDGSKVVDSNGNPLPVYHGTRSSVNFDTFSVDGPPVDDSDYEGQPMSSGSGADPTSLMGAHFAVQPNVANQFAEGKGWTSTRYEGDKEMPRVIQVYLRITNPKDFGSEHNLREFINQGKVSGDALEIAMEADGIQPYADTNEGEAAINEWYNKYENDQAFRTEKNRFLFEEARGGEGSDDLLRDAAYELASQARQRLEAAGYDGIHYKNVVEGGTAWVAFEPNQIKSVWAQSFNPRDPRFTASVRVEPVAPVSPIPADLPRKPKQEKKKEEPKEEKLLDVYASVPFGMSKREASGEKEIPGKIASKLVTAMGYDEIKRGTRVFYLPTFLDKHLRLKGEVKKVLRPAPNDTSPDMRPLIVVKWDAGHESTVPAWTLANAEPQKSLFAATPAPARAGLTIPAGTLLYRGIGEDEIHTHKPASDGCLWTTQSPTFARTYIPPAGLEMMATLKSIASCPNDRSGVADLQKQLGFEYTDIKYDATGRPNSYRAPKLLETLYPHPYPDKTKFEKQDDYYKAANDWQVGREEALMQYVKKKLAEYGYEPERPEDNYHRGQYRLKLHMENGHEELLPNKFEEGTVCVFEVQQPLNVFDMTEGGQNEGDLLDPQYREYGKFEQLAKMGYDGVKINDYAQVEGHGNVGHTAIGIFEQSVPKIKEIRRDTATHPEDLWADVKKYGSLAEDKVKFDEFKAQLKFPLTVYRGLGVAPEEINFENVGPFWSVDEGLAEDAMRGDRNNLTLLRTQIREDAVDWEETFLQNKRFCWGEKEVYVKPGTDVEITGIRRSYGDWQKPEPEKRWVTAASKPTPTQLDGLQHMADGKALYRVKGGFWTVDPVTSYDTFGIPKGEDGNTIWYVPTRTMEAMEKRGWVARANKYPEVWKDDRVITEAGLAAIGKKTASADEPGLLWRAPEDNGHHDYQPSWDYEPRANSDPELAELAVGVAQRLYQRTKQPFELWDVDLSHLNAVAMYIDGTCGYPVVLIDLEAHRDYPMGIGKSIDHELKHAIQDSEGREYDEEEAESDDFNKEAAAEVYLYHGTTATIAEKIMLDGVMEAGSYWGTERIAATYAEEAVDAELDYEAEAEEAIIRVPLSRFNKANLEPDENSVAEPLTYTLKRKEDELYAEWQNSQGTWEDCLRIYESVRYDAPLQVTKNDRYV